MLRNIVLFILTTTIATAEKCPQHCLCSQDVATCNMTNFTSFGERVFKLKIENPREPFAIKNGLFNVTGLQDVDSITIESAKILDIKDKAFLAIPKLSTLKIVNSSLPRIDNPLTFSLSKKLRILQICNSGLKEFDSLKFNFLEELDLSGNSLTTLSKSNFERIPTLTFINLDGNNISVVDPSTFSTLINLQEILLSNNNITSLDPNTFESNTELLTINLSKNPIKQLNLNLVSDLEKLVLRSCQLTTFSESFSDNLKLLSYLDLADNNIELTENTFAKLEELEFIDLSQNNLKKLNSRLFYYNRKLQKIILDHNSLEDFPKLETRTNFETYYLSCSNCGIMRLPENAFKYFSSVSVLVLSNNQLTGANLTSLQNLYNLIEINLSFNNISVLNSAWFAKSSGLQKVNLSGNPIKSIDSKAFYSNRVLKYLDVSHCALQTLWKRPVKNILLKSLYEINVAHNQLTSVSPQDLEIIPSIKVLGISNNLLHCDKILHETMDWLSNQGVLPLSPTSKTHENIFRSNSDESADVLKTPSWRFLAKERCLDEFYFENSAIVEKNISSNNHHVEITKPRENVRTESNVKSDDEDDEDYVDEDNLKSDEDYTRAKELYDTIRFKSNKDSVKYSFLWPTLVFIFTALSVLVIAANVLLLILRSRAAIPRDLNIPHIKIPRWNTNNKLKKHSGSVYQPLSEERTEMFVPNGLPSLITHSNKCRV